MNTSKNLEGLSDLRTENSYMAIYLEPDKFYHIYNRGNGNEDVFTNADNYRFFLEKFKQYVAPIVNTYCYCLMPNHFHFLVQVKSDKEVLEVFKFENSEACSKAIANQFGKFFNAYAKAYNSQQNRKGSVFMKNFKRKLVKDKEYLRKLVHYIHNNPIEAELCSVPEEYPYSSYEQIITNKSTFIKSQEIISWFNDIENFICFHKLSPALKDVD